MPNADVIVIGGGMVGSAIGYGLAQAGLDVAILDEGDVAFRAARVNFGLVWTQSKGLGLQRYQQWSRQSADLWPDFAAELGEAAGIDVGYEKPGGVTLCVGDEDFEERRRFLDRMRQQAGSDGYDCDMIDRRDVQDLMPEMALGEAVVGGAYCPHDGHTNPLYLLRAMHAGYAAAGGRYYPEHPVEDIERDGATFLVVTPRARFTAPKLVLAAGHGIVPLAPMVGLDVPTRPERGQVLVSERTQHVLPLPTHVIRQTVEGSFMMGNSAEDVGFDDRTTIDIAGTIAARAVKSFPALAGLRLVRTWAGLRVMPPDGFPIYDESETCPGAFVATMHSGVTLAAIHARLIARWIAEGESPPGFGQFSARRFDVQATV